MKTHTRGRAKRTALSLRSAHRILSILTLMFMLTSLLAPIASQTAFAQDATTTGDQTIVVEPAEQPAAPVSEDPAAPVVEEPVAPVVEEPAAPVVEEPAAPVVEEPAAPVVDEPVAPVVEEPAAPVVEEPAAPVVEEPAAPASEEQAAPAVEAPADTTSSVEAVVDPVEEVVADPSAATCAASNATAPNIASDLADYAPGSTVTLTGSGWVPGQTVEIFIDDDGVADAEMGAWSLFQKVDADQNGNIFFQFSIPNWFVADYFVTATGECTNASTTFTDAQVGSATISPTTAISGFPTDFTITVTNNSSSGNATDRIASVSILIPAGFSSVAAKTVPAGWTYSVSGGQITLTGSTLSRNNSMTLVVTATATSVGSQTWTTSATSGSGGAFNFTSQAMTVSVIGSAVPGLPSVSGAACSDGVYNPVLNPATTTGIDYNVTSFNKTTGAYTINATLQSGYAFGTLPEGWSATGQTATYSGSVTVTPCVSVVPVAPAFADGACVEGAYTRPSVALAENGGGITYSGGTINSDGTFTVTASLGSTYVFGTLPTGWNLVSGGRTATFSGSVAANDCITAVLVAPAFADGVCTDGIYTAPKLTLAENGQGVKYTGGTIQSDGTFVVTATLDSNANFGNTYGWTVVGRTATFSGTVASNDCLNVDLPVVDFADGVCIDGTHFDRYVNLPPDFDGVTFSGGEIGENGDFIITAELASNANFNETGTWVLNGRTATFSGNVAVNDCITAELVIPTFADGVCKDGVYTAPEVTLADDGKGVKYTVSEIDASGDFVVTATLDSNANFDNTEGWVVTGRTATFSGNVTFNPCIEVDLPVVTDRDGVCEEGVYAGPGVNMPANGNGVSYDRTTIDSNGNYVVTATLDSNAKFVSTEGWTLSEDGRTATFTGEVDLGKCLEVSLPVVTDVDGVCTNGAYTDPIVNMPADGNGVAYTRTTIDSNGNYVVTATLDSNAKFVSTDSWTMADGSRTATLDGNVTLGKCLEVSLPVVTDADGVCTNGAYTDPIVNMPADGNGVKYTRSLIDSNGNYVVTATLDSNAKFVSTDGWTSAANGRTATLNGNVNLGKCIDAVLVAPTVKDGVCEAGVYTAPSVKPAADGQGVKYTGGTVNADNTFTVTATLDSNANFGTTSGWTVNGRTATFSGTVKANKCVTVSQFQHPIDTGKTINETKAGSTIPFKFTVTEGTTPLGANDISRIKVIIATTSCSTGGVIDTIEITSSEATSFRYDSTSGTFIYNWKTSKTPGCYSVTVSVDGKTPTGTPVAIIKTR